MKRILHAVVEGQGYYTMPDGGRSEFLSCDLQDIRRLMSGSEIKVVCTDKAPSSKGGQVAVYDFDGDRINVTFKGGQDSFPLDNIPGYVADLINLQNDTPAKRWLQLKHRKSDIHIVPRSLALNKNELSFPMEYRNGAYHSQKYGLNMCSDLTELFPDLENVLSSSRTTAPTTVYAVITPRKRAGFRAMYFHDDCVTDEQSEMTTNCGEELLDDLRALVKNPSKLWVGFALQVRTTSRSAAAKKAWATRQQRQASVKASAAAKKAWVTRRATRQAKR